MKELNLNSYDDVVINYIIMRKNFSLLNAKVYKTILNALQAKMSVHDNVMYFHHDSTLIAMEKVQSSTLGVFHYRFGIYSDIINGKAHVARMSGKLMQDRVFSTLRGHMANIHVQTVEVTIKHNEYSDIESLKDIFNTLLEDCFVQQDCYFPCAVRPHKFLSKSTISEPSIGIGTNILYEADEVLAFLNDKDSDAHFNITLSTSRVEQYLMAVATLPGWTEKVREKLKMYEAELNRDFEISSLQDEAVAAHYVRKLNYLNIAMEGNKHA